MFLFFFTGYLTFGSTQVRAAEDILSLTRVLKEAWLFGKLNTVGASEAEARADGAAAGVVVGLRAVVEEG